MARCGVNDPLVANTTSKSSIATWMLSSRNRRRCGGGELLFPFQVGITKELSLHGGLKFRRQSMTRRNLASSYGLPRPKVQISARFCRWHASCISVERRGNLLRWSVITERSKISHWCFGPNLESPSICFPHRTGFERQTWYIYEERQRDERSQGMGDRPRVGQSPLGRGARQTPGRAGLVDWRVSRYP